MPELTPTVSGQDAYVSVQGLLTDVQIDVDRLLPFSIARVLAPLETERQRLLKALPTLTAPMTEAAKERFEADLTLLQRLAHAGAWISAQYDRQVTAQSRLQTSIKEATGLRQSGLRAMEVLERLGVVSDADLKAIRAGQGYLDLAGDLQALGVRLAPHWTILDPLQSLQPDLSLRLTEPLVRRMEPLGLEVLAALQDRKPATEGTDWHGELLRCQVTLEGLWDKLRYTAVGGHAQAGELETARAGYPSLRAMQRRA